jgi:acyl carrier protein
MGRRERIGSVKEGITTLLNIKEELRQIASDLFGTDELPDDASPETVAAWDSIQHLNLVLAVEEKFGVQLDAEDLTDMPTLAQIAESIQRKRG